MPEKDEEIGLPLCKLSVEALDGFTRFTLTVSNNTDTRAVIQFPTSQHYDFIVKSSDGNIVWQWSRGKMFTQMLTAISLDPGEEKEFIEEYSLPAGKYMVQGILRSTPERIFTRWEKFTVKPKKTKKHIPIKGKITKILDKLYLLGEDGTAYLIVNPSEKLLKLQGKKIEVTSYKIEPIQGTIDKMIFIEEYKE